MFKKVLVPVDLQDTQFCLTALKLALREVHGNGAQLHIIAVVPGYNNSIVSSFFSEKEHQESLKRFSELLVSFANEHVDEQIKSELKVFEGSASEEINRYVRNNGIDLVVMRAHQRSKIDAFLLGSVSARVVERAFCSVFVLRS
ncbi:MAG: universal stress protein [Oceanospirillaceae bacterium]|nr:universal stress protein [Oceanospirillaceae bacterium]